jgi:hypothetical protein
MKLTQERNPKVNLIGVALLVAGVLTSSNLQGAEAQRKETVAAPRNSSVTDNRESI